MSYTLLKKFNRRPDADLAKGYLESKGVHAILKTGDAAGMYPSLSFVDESIHLLVDEKDLVKSEKLLEETT